MVSLGRKLQQRPSLWILYLLSIWVLGTQANFVDVNSCSNWRQYSDTRGNIRSYGNKLTQVESAVSETAKMTTEASQAIAAVKAKRAGFFDRMRTLMLFFALFGDAGGQQAWDDAYNPILARDPNANRWWPENERPCEPSDDHFALGADFKYVILCHKALEQNGVTIA
ncbi:hypothetical protein NUU61_006052 [Penicillium alfredii]|uniref:Uncharacterized protein n=1 Tax=Penicillium alfredii TaxID=1506179 RepID=A0A9W9F093_9EURO|nr:uncharacterized protein NUU61_006052 [Penicillium alfredii]KAJ5091182.1 hypothetical protein NUU61_006052 [Penicillium alfredii]